MLKNIVIVVLLSIVFSILTYIIVRILDLILTAKQHREQKIQIAEIKKNIRFKNCTFINASIVTVKDISNNQVHYYKEQDGEDKEYIQDVESFLMEYKKI